ncbi:MAG: methyltransferase MtaB domain-containing protein [Oliverpabstia sp.]|nr:methanol--corrinoid methyltransferase [Lachnospiraceae bacterium]MDY5026351.1 methyltransferase MtaB domain-containing protein [Oliverpabstia sp.]
MGIQFTKLAYESVNDFVYGSCPKPVTLKNGMVIGGGIIYPEVNFTLPAMNATSETLPQYTEHPEWGIEIHKILRDSMYEFEAKYGLKSALRMTPNDLREMNRPPVMRSGKYWDSMLRIFDQTAKDGADILAIESTGGKEINDEAIVNADLRTSVFALGCLGARDMKWLWSNITRIANENGVIPGGDSSCGFANTSMVLAEQGFIPKVYAAVMRAMVTPRALVAIENGAVGPGKDCAYENVYLKAITGTPISLEGKSAACAHFSPIGNIAAAVADLWSNESVQQVKLLSGFAPVVSTEQLIYDCRLMNTATKKGQRTWMRDLLIESDCYLDPQAYVLKPENVFKIAEEIVKTQDPFLRTLNTGRQTLEIIQQGVDKGELSLEERELSWLDRFRDQLDEIPENEEEFIEEMKDELDDTKYNIHEYGL